MSADSEAEAWRAAIVLAPSSMLLAELHRRDVAGEIRLASKSAGPVATVLTLLIYIPLVIALWHWALG